jgi:coenzyme F420-reducing hydrogenase gamma subunit
MEYLGIKASRPKIGVFDFTSCEGCELQLSNKEETLGPFLDAVQIVNFREISSGVGQDYAIAFIEGAITRKDEIERLKDIRERAQVLVALGTCACFGGVNRQKNAYDLDEANAEVYGDKPKPTQKTQAVHEVVEVDLSIPGCPVSKVEIERIVRHVIMSIDYKFPVYPVCIECKRRFNTCLFDLGKLCLGSITMAGCNAPCPTGELGCWGCRGPAKAINIEEFKAAAKRHGFSKTEVNERLSFFGGFEGILCE